MPSGVCSRGFVAVTGQRGPEVVYYIFILKPLVLVMGETQQPELDPKDVIMLDSRLLVALLRHCDSLSQDAYHLWYVFQLTLQKLTEEEAEASSARCIV